MDEVEKYETTLSGLISLKDKITVAREGYASEALPGSLAERELSGFMGSEACLNALSQGQILAAATSEHVELVTRALSSPVLAIASWSATRAALESSSLACWLLSMEVSPLERAARSFAFRYAGLSQQRKMRRAVEDSDLIEEIDRRIVSLEESALKLGLSRVTTRNGRRSGVGMQMPTITDLIENVQSRGRAYRIMSSMVHAHPWAMQQLSFSIRADNSGTPLSEMSYGTESYRMEKSMSFASVVYLAKHSARSLVEAEVSRLRILGHSTQELDSTYRDFVESMNNCVTAEGAPS